MRHIYFLAAVLLLHLTACNKNTDTEYHITFSVNGVQKKYKGAFVGGQLDPLPNSALVFQGATSASSFNDYIGFYIDNYPGGTAIVAGQYTDDSNTFTLLSGYGNGTDYESGQSMYQDAITNNVTITNHLKLTITYIDDERISGTFSGDYYADGDVVAGQKISITNGSFNVKLQ